MGAFTDAEIARLTEAGFVVDEDGIAVAEDARVTLTAPDSTDMSKITVELVGGGRLTVSIRREQTH